MGNSDHGATYTYLIMCSRQGHAPTRDMSKGYETRRRSSHAWYVLEMLWPGSVSASASCPSVVSSSNPDVRLGG